MLKCMLISMALLFSFPMSVLGESNPPKLTEEALLSSLFPKINKALEKKQGTSKKYDCTTIKQLKKVYPHTYIFESVIEIVTYQKDYKPPYNKVTLTFSNEEGEWEIISMKEEKLADTFIFKCEKPS